MEILDTVITGAMLAVFGVVLHLLVKAQLDGLRREIGTFREYTEKRLDSLERRIERLEVAVAALRADLTQIALAVGARLRPETG
jgi:chaperonin cofactor prefoldin